MSTARDGGIAFAWDDAKAATNLRKHRLSFHEAITVFLDPLAIIVEDSTVGEEQRQVIIGRSLRLRTVIAVFVERGEPFESSRRARRRSMRNAGTKKASERGPSKASLAEIPEVSFRDARVRRNPYARRIGARGRRQMIAE